MKKFISLTALSFIFIFGACNCGSQKNSIMNDTRDFTNGIIYHNVQFANSDYGVDEEEKRIIEKALCKLEIIVIYEDINSKLDPIVRGGQASGFFPFESEEELFFLTAGHVTNRISEFPDTIILIPEGLVNIPNIYTLKEITFKIWTTNKKEDIITFSSKDVRVVTHQDSQGIDFGILSFKKRPGLNLKATPVKWATTENLESGDKLYLFSEPNGKGKFFTKGDVENPGEINYNIEMIFGIISKNIFYMSNEMSMGSSGGPVFAIGKEDKKLYLVGIAIVINFKHIGIIYKIASRIDPVIEALQNFQK